MEVDLPNLPNDIISFQILTRLPAKSLMRFKCVCKFWSSSLFRDPLFVKAHRNMHKNHTSLLLLGNQHKSLFSVQLKHELGFTNSPTPPVAIDDLLSLDTQMTASILGYGHYSRSFGANGLICLWDSDASVPVLTLNPSTREFTTLPLSQLGQCYPSSVYNTYHIGCTPHTNEYKVFHMHRKCETKFEVFTLGSTMKSWRDVPKIGFDEELQCSDGKSVCIHGAIHWVVRTVRNMKILRTAILALDVGEETFRLIPIPQKCKSCNMIEVNGYTAMYKYYNDHTYEADVGIDMMGIWILKDHKNQVWIEESIVLPDTWCKLGWPSPVCTIHTGELLLCCMEYGGFRDVHLYDMKRKSYRKTEIKLPGSILASFDESIVPL